MVTADATKPRMLRRAEVRRIQRKARERFRRAHRAEQSFSRQLRQVARQVGAIIKGFAPRGVVQNTTPMVEALRRYADMLRPWAEAVSGRLIAEVGKRDEHAWNELGREIGRALGVEIRGAATGEQMRKKMLEQVALITSLPLDAAKHVHEWTIRSLEGGARAKEAAAEILKTGKVTTARAMLIARTETTRTATAMTEARARYIGSEGYIWRTAGDGAVRETHRKLNGRFFKWDDPPVAGESGERSHPGAIYNCRCYAEPVIPEQL